MSGISKRVSGAWVSGDERVMKTDTDTITTLPAVIYPNDTTATVGLVGNMTQSGTPTPDSPIMPQGTGERTGNLAPPLTEWVDGYIATNGFIAAPSNINIEKTSDYIPIKGGVPYTFSRDNGFPRVSGSAWRAIGWYDINKAFISRDAYNTENSLSAEAPQNAAYCRLSYRTYGETTNATFNEGSTALPYEPYGYKIPISSANTTTPVYLGQVESTRQIKKLVLTGSVDENITLYTIATGNLFRIELPSLRRLAQFYGNGMCTHYRSVYRSADRINGTISGGDAAAVQGVVDIVDDYATVSDFKSYLQQQYAAGTPVTVWCVLATPETAVVNEPLMKIGDYADEVANISIPVTAGGDTISVDTTLQPSEVTVNYKGWHPAIVHERTNGAWS